MRRKSPAEDLLFVHIPKTAGISLYSAFEDLYGAKNCLRWADAGELPDYLATPERKLRAARVLSGHFTYPQFQQKAIGSRLVIALLRDPLERVLSVYYYLRSMPDHRHHSLVDSVDCEEYLEKHMNGKRRSRQCLYFAGNNRFADALSAAESQFDLLGAVERMPDFVSALAERLDVQGRLQLEHKNATRGKRLHGDQLAPDLVARFREAHDADYRLWERVMESDRGLIGRAVSR